jgi:hypothetical protein
MRSPSIWEKEDPYFTEICGIRFLKIRWWLPVAVAAWLILSLTSSVIKFTAMLVGSHPGDFIEILDWPLVLLRILGG